MSGPKPVAVADLGDLGQIADAMAAKEAPGCAEVQLISTVKTDDERDAFHGRVAQTLQSSQRVDLAGQGHDRKTIRMGIDLLQGYIGRSQAIFALRRMHDLFPRAGDAGPRPPWRIGVRVKDDCACDFAALEQVAEYGGHDAAACTGATNDGVAGVGRANAADRAKFLTLDRQRTRPRIALSQTILACPDKRVCTSRSQCRLPAERRRAGMLRRCP